MTDLEPLKFTPVRFTENDLGPYLLESITKGLYVDPLHAIREYVQNAVEADPPASNVKVMLQGKNISIWDDGGGMDKPRLEIAKKVGFSTKTPEDSFGFRGLGIYAGVPVCESILISTKRRGETRRHFLEIDAKGLLEEILVARTNKPATQLLTEHVKEADQSAPSHEHGSHVQLINIADEFREHFTFENINFYLAQTLPVDLHPDFPYRDSVTEEIRQYVPDYRVCNIFFNGTPIHRPPFVKDIGRPISGVLRDKKTPIAFYWFCIHEDNKAIEEKGCSGLVYKKKGFTVGDRGSCLSWWRKSQHLLFWITGEIHVIDLRLIPNSERMDFETCVAKDIFIKKLQEELETTVDDEVRKKSFLDRLKKDVELVEQSPRKIKFSAAEEQASAIAEIAGAKKRLKRALRHKHIRFASRQLKTKIPSAIKHANKLEKTYLTAPVKGVKKSIVVKERIEPPPRVTVIKPTGIPSLVDAFRDLKITEQTKVVIETIERIIDEFFRDPKTCSELKQKIIEELRMELSD